tara:strand:+ start:1147 stop:1275 length:129 start_codon:yes stop_codon:yes gene_type:complete
LYEVPRRIWRYRYEVKTLGRELARVLEKDIDKDYYYEINWEV